MTLREAVDRYVAWQRDHGATTPGARRPLRFVVNR